MDINYFVFTKLNTNPNMSILPHPAEVLEINHLPKAFSIKLHFKAKIA
jgi:hypothetical protein